MEKMRSEGTTPAAVVGWYKDTAKRWHTLTPSAADIHRLGLDIATLLYAGIPVPRELLRDYTGQAPVGGWRWCPTPESITAAVSTEPELPPTDSASPPRKITRTLSVIKEHTRRRKKTLKHASPENDENAAPVATLRTPDSDSDDVKDMPAATTEPRPFRSPLANVAMRSRDFYKKQNPFSRFR